MLCSCAEAARGACRGSAAPYRPWLWRARCQPRPDRGRTTTSGTRRFGRAGARAVSERGRARVRGGHGLVGAGRGRGWRGREKMTGKTLSMLPSIESSLIRSAAKPRQSENVSARLSEHGHWTLAPRPSSPARRVGGRFWGIPDENGFSGKRLRVRGAHPWATSPRKRFMLGALRRSMGAIAQYFPYGGSRNYFLSSHAPAFTRRERCRAKHTPRPFPF